MKCPNDKHDNYCPEEDSVCTFEPEFKQECAQCVLEERDSLKQKNELLLKSLKDVLRYLVTTKGLKDSGKGRTDQQQAVLDTAHKLLRG